MRIFSLVLGLLVISSCGPKIFLAKEKAQTIDRTVALLPLSASNDIPSERKNYIQNALASELASAGYVVLDRKIVESVCPTADCPDKEKLSKTYATNTFARLNLESVAKTNFIAGYYNTITGKLSFQDLAGNDIATVDNTERERGGLLFNTGQIFQGLKSHHDNSGDASFTNLADRFVKTLVEKVPAPKTAETESRAESERVTINKVTATTGSNSQIHVCINSNPGLMASLLIDSNKANLREISSGQYCGNFWLGALKPGSKLMVEAKSAYGTTERRDVSFENSRICNLEGKVVVADSGSKKTISINCTKTPAGGPVVGNCTQAIEECPKDNKIYVYRGPSEEGPFERVAEVRGSSWTDMPKGQAFYHLVAKNALGLRAVPVEAEPASTENK